MIRSGNPALSENTFLDLGAGTVVSRNSEVMTLNGTVNKTGILLLLAVLTAAFAWNGTLDDSGQPTAMAMIYLWGGVIGGLILSMVTIFKKTWAPVSAPLYALAEGFFLTAAAQRNRTHAEANGLVFDRVPFGVQEVLFDACCMAALDLPWDKARWRETSTLSGGEQKRLALEVLLRGHDGAGTRGETTEQCGERVVVTLHRRSAHRFRVDRVGSRGLGLGGLRREQLVPAGFVGHS